MIIKQDVMKKIFGLLVSLVCISVSYNVSAQADTLVSVCTKHMTPPYISDGQQYQTILSGEEVAEFHVSFLGGSTYRMVGCSGLTDGNLVFNVYDNEKNLIFTNSDFENAPYWDFKFNYSMDCVIEAKLDSKNTESGFAIMLIGFKQ